MILPLRFRCAVLPSLLVLLAGGCNAHSPAGGLPNVRMQIGSRNFEVEVAATEQEENKGLMQRDSMPDDHGMIFIMPEEKTVTFWMKNTRFNLDILFLDHSGTIVSIHQMKAYDESLTSSDHPAKYAVELNAGAAASAGVKVGDTLQIPEAVRNAKRN